MADISGLPEFMDATTARRIASHYLPSRWHYHYSKSKLNSDPLYDGVCAALLEQPAPVLDLGCGIGLLAHCLRQREQQAGLEPALYVGLDNDAGKIGLAQRGTGSLINVRFAVTDLTGTLPEHHGHVVILDVLQYLPPVMQQHLLDHACATLGPSARLVIRTGMADDSWRFRITRSADYLGRLIRWMNTGPKEFPTRAGLDRTFAAHGLKASYQPLWGNTPFNNWLVIAGKNLQLGF